MNELEYVDGFVYANIWYEDILVRINPDNGLIDKQWDISSLADAEEAYQHEVKNYVEADCLNGIAYN